MDIQFDFDQAGTAENAYEQTITSLKENINSIKNTYESLRGTSWDGNAEEGFMARFDEIHGLWESFIGQIEATQQAIGTTKTTAEPIREKSDSLM